MAAMFDNLDRSVDAFTGRYPSIEHQVGGLFFINRRPAGLECFDTPGVWRKLWPKLLRSYALDAIDYRQADSPPRPTAADGPAFVARIIASTATTFRATGDGEDVRLTGHDVVGAALVARGRMVHLSAFPHM